jgi:hypothetical protein
MITAFRGESVCPKCAEKAREINKNNEKVFERQMSEHYSLFPPHGGTR